LQVSDWRQSEIFNLKLQSGIFHLECSRHMQPITNHRSARKSRGFTLIELIVATVILVILTGMAIPMARVTIKRQRERELRAALWEMRDAIDRYKDAADRGAFQIKVGSQGYPPDLDTLVKGIDVNGKKLKFLRRIPVDPMTGKTEWGMRSMQDDPDSDSWDGDNVFDVYSKSEDMALDDTKYKEW
jgi:general secretion pathway protein G